MSLFRANVWSVVDIGLLRWCCVLIGMIVGAHLADFTKQNVWFIALGALLLGIEPAVSYFRGGRERTTSGVGGNRKRTVAPASGREAPPPIRSGRDPRPAGKFRPALRTL